MCGKMLIYNLIELIKKGGLREVHPYDLDFEIVTSVLRRRL
jgi:hypothetical protein